MKTLAIRLEDEQHARLTILARLSDVSVTDAIRQAIDTHVAAMAADPAIAARAAALQEEIEQEAAQQRAAIAGLFGDTPTTATTPRRSSNKGGSSTR